MRHYESPWQDIQQQCPVENCPKCKLEIYRYDMVASISGRLVHEHCMTEEELEDYPTYPAISFFEEAC